MTYKVIYLWQNERHVEGFYETLGLANVASRSMQQNGWISWVEEVR